MSEVKVNKVSPRSGTTLTIGDSGDTTNVVGTLNNNGASLLSLANGVDNRVITSSSATALNGEANLTFDGSTLGVNGAAIFNESGADKDFRVESDGNANMLFVDGGNNRVGIGTSSPGYKLTVQASADNQDLIRLNHPSAATAGAMLGFTTDGTTANNVVTLGVQFSNADFDVINIQRSTQNVGIGETAPLGKLHVKSADSGASVNSGHNQVIAENSGNSGMSILSGTSSNGAICFGDSGNNCIGYVNYAHNGNHLDFGVNGAEKMRIISNGNVGIGITDPGSNAVNITVADTRVTSGRVLDVHHTKTDTTFTGQVARIQSARNTTNGTYEFIRCAISGVANKFIVTDGGTIQAVNTTVASISDERIKQDIVDAKSQWNDIKALKFKNFKKKQAVRDDGDNALKELGVIAQDVESAGMNGLIEMSNPDISSIKSDSSFGTLWTEDDEEVKNGTETVGEVKEIKEQVKTVKYSMIWMKSVKALQEAMERIETLEAEVTALKNQP